MSRTLEVEGLQKDLRYLRVKELEIQRAIEAAKATGVKKFFIDLFGDAVISVNLEIISDLKKRGEITID